MRPQSRVIFAVLGILVAGGLLLRLSNRNLRSLEKISRRVDQKVGFQGTHTPAADATPVTARKFPAPSLANLKESASVRRILADCDAAAGSLFEEGMRLLDDGDTDGARSRFEHLIEAYPNDNTRPPATWAIGLCYYTAYYRGGGTHNLHQAANQFIRFRDGYGSDSSLEDLVQAAMMDIPVISIELMRFAPSEYERTHAAALAESTLKAFLARWPDDPRAAAARIELAEVQSFISNAR